MRSVVDGNVALRRIPTHTHTHTHIYIYIHEALRITITFEGFILQLLQGQGAGEN